MTIPPFPFDTLADFHAWLGTYGITPWTFIMIRGAAVLAGFAVLAWYLIDRRRTQPTQDDLPSTPANGAIRPDLSPKS